MIGLRIRLRWWRIRGSWRIDGDGLWRRVFGPLWRLERTRPRSEPRTLGARLDELYEERRREMGL